MTADIVQELRDWDGSYHVADIRGFCDFCSTRMPCDWALVLDEARRAADEIERFRTAEFIGRLPDYVKELETERDEAYDRIRETERDEAYDRIRETERDEACNRIRELEDTVERLRAGHEAIAFLTRGRSIIHRTLISNVHRIAEAHR